MARSSRSKAEVKQKRDLGQQIVATKTEIDLVCDLNGVFRGFKNLVQTVQTGIWFWDRNRSRSGQIFCGTMCDTISSARCCKAELLLCDCVVTPERLKCLSCCAIRATVVILLLWPCFAVAELLLCVAATISVLRRCYALTALYFDFLLLVAVNSPQLACNYF